MTEDMDIPFPMAPVHPFGPELEAQLQPLKGWLARWVWGQDEDGAVWVVLVLKMDGTSLRVWLSTQTLELDAFAGYAPYDAACLMAVLMHNHSRVYKARATQAEGAVVPIYLSARFGVAALPQLGAHVWNAFEEAFLWRGLFNSLHARVEAAPSGVPA